jgi:hypothetical protein
MPNNRCADAVLEVSVTVNCVGVIESRAYGLATTSPRWPLHHLAVRQALTRTARSSVPARPAHSVAGRGSTENRQNGGPLRTRETACEGCRRALEAHREVAPPSRVDPGIAEAVERQTAARGAVLAHPGRPFPGLPGLLGGGGYGRAGELPAA